VALTVEKLCHSYGTTTVLEDVSFSAPAGRLTVILGRNGCGKSTLLKALAGINPAQRGSVLVNGSDLTGMSGAERASLIGYLPQFHQTVFPFTVEDVVLTGRAAYVLSTPSGADREKACQAIQDVGIGHLAGRPYSELSGGERQMVMIARVLAQNPKVILLDEPASHLDLANQQRLFRIIRRVTAGGTAVVAVLHDPNMAFLNGDQVVFLREGRVITPPEGCSPWDPYFIGEIYGVPLCAFPYRDRALVIPAYVEGEEDES